MFCLSSVISSIPGGPARYMLYIDLYDNATEVIEKVTNVAQQEKAGTVHSLQNIVWRSSQRSSTAQTFPHHIFLMMSRYPFNVSQQASDVNLIQ